MSKTLLQELQEHWKDSENINKYFVSMLMKTKDTLDEDVNQESEDVLLTILNNKTIPEETKFNLTRLDGCSRIYQNIRNFTKIESEELRDYAIVRSANSNKRILTLWLDQHYTDNPTSKRSDILFYDLTQFSMLHLLGDLRNEGYIETKSVYEILKYICDDSEKTLIDYLNIAYKEYMWVRTSLNSLFGKDIGKEIYKKLDRSLPDLAYNESLFTNYSYDNTLFHIQDLKWYTQFIIFIKNRIKNDNSGNCCRGRRDYMQYLTAHTEYQPYLEALTNLIDAVYLATNGETKFNKNTYAAKLYKLHDNNTDKMYKTIYDAYFKDLGFTY